jgi:cytosine/creatinine deaminase
MDSFLRAAIAEAKKGLASGGIPIGSVLVCDGKILGAGHNQRVQHGSVIHHGEMNALENAGRHPASVYQRSVMYTTLSPCPMCSGAIVLYKIPHVIVAENQTFLGAEEYLRSQGVRVDVLQNEECIQLMRDFIAKNPTLWNEDIGV